MDQREFAEEALGDSGVEIGGQGSPPQYDFSWLPTTSIILPTYNEEENVGACLDSLLSQSLIEQYPTKFETIVVDSHSSDGTRSVVENYPVRLIVGPRGKLTARKIATDYSNGEIIVAVDADTTYPKYWLVYMLRHFYDPQVVAVAGPRLFSDHTYLNLASGLRQRGFMRWAHYMPGSTSAYHKWAFYATGGWRDVNQFDSLEIQPEEEIAFGDRLATVGKYVFDDAAVSYTSARRFSGEEKHGDQRKRGERF